MPIENHNVIFITLDSLSLSTAKLAKELFLNKISSLVEAESHATYTYPAHHSFFLGILPRLTDPTELYLGKYRQIWRSSLSRKSNNTVAIAFDDSSILNYYKKLGHQVIGFGGVLFFDTSSNSNTLPDLFDEFRFFGPTEKFEKRPYPRNPEWFPLNQIEHITGSIAREPYFLFINSNATHVPYDNPESIVNEVDIQLMERLFVEHSNKVIHPQDGLPFSEEETSRLINNQLASLIWADRQIHRLIDSIPRKRPTILIVCGDHGEEFGEGGRYGHAHAHPAVTSVPYWDCILPAKSE